MNEVLKELNDEDLIFIIFQYNDKIKVQKEEPIFEILL